jgi:hypothetical protein
MGTEIERSLITRVVAVLFATTLIGAATSEAQASCGDYLHLSRAGEFAPQDVRPVEFATPGSLPAPCRGPACRDGYPPPVVPAAPIEISRVTERLLGGSHLCFDSWGASVDRVPEPAVDPLSGYLPGIDRPPQVERTSCGGKRA